jgi:hypothetical protein
VGSGGRGKGGWRERDRERAGQGVCEREDARVRRTQCATREREREREAPPENFSLVTLTSFQFCRNVCVSYFLQEPSDSPVISYSSSVPLSSLGRTFVCRPGSKLGRRYILVSSPPPCFLPVCVCVALPPFSFLPAGPRIQTRVHRTLIRSTLPLTSGRENRGERACGSEANVRALPPPQKNRNLQNRHPSWTQPPAIKHQSETLVHSHRHLLNPIPL